MKSAVVFLIGALLTGSALGQQDANSSNEPATGVPKPTEGSGVKELQLNSTWVQTPAEGSGVKEFQLNSTVFDGELYWFNLLTARDVQLLDTFGAVTLPVQDDILRAHLKLPANQGIVVTGVAPATPAADAGLQRGDILLSIADKPMFNQQSLVKVLQDGGQDVRIDLIRGGNTAFLTTQLLPLVAETTSYRIGITAKGAEDTLRVQLRIPDGQGLVVTELVKEGPAARAGLQKHDVLVRINDQPLGSLDDLRRLINESQGKEVVVHLIRLGREVSLPVTPDAVTVLERENPPVAHTLGYDLNIPMYIEPYRVRLTTVRPETAASPELDSILEKIDELRAAVEKLKER